VTNAADAPASGTITTDVLQTARFRITQDACNGVALAPSGSCLITVVFEPLVDGPDQAVIGVSASPGGQPNLNITGTGAPGVTLGGTVTGHSTVGTLVLRNNGYDDISIAAGQLSFTFPERIGSVWNITVVTNPLGRSCVVTANATGVASTQNITNVEVTCSVVPTNYRVQDGPPHGTQPPTYSCVETCALLFGGTSTNWACSTDAVVVNNQAFTSRWGGPCAIQSESYKVGTIYNTPGNVSAYVADHCFAGQRNYCVLQP
jgi:hypothetical protein